MSVLEEWWTGRDADGAELPGAGWKDGPFGRMRSMPAIETLSARLARTLPGDAHVRVRLARGEDGETQVRIEVERPGNEPVVTRWRPEGADLDSQVVECGRTLARARAPQERQRFLEQCQSAMTADASRMTLDDTHAHISTLKRFRAELGEVAEALVLAGRDPAPAQSQLAAVHDRLAVIRAQHDDLNTERRLRLRGD